MEESCAIHSKFSETFIIFFKEIYKGMHFKFLVAFGEKLTSLVLTYIACQIYTFIKIRYTSPSPPPFWPKG